MSDKAKLNTVLILQVLTFAGLAFAYYKVAPLIDQAQTTLEKTNALEDKVGHLL